QPAGKQGQTGFFLYACMAVSDMPDTAGKGRRQDACQEHSSQRQWPGQQQQALQQGTGAEAGGEQRLPGTQAASHPRQGQQAQQESQLLGLHAQQCLPSPSRPGATQQQADDNAKQPGNGIPHAPGVSAESEDGQYSEQYLGLQGNHESSSAAARRLRFALARAGLSSMRAPVQVIRMSSNRA